MPNHYADVIAELHTMEGRISAIRDRHCEPKNAANPRYHGLSLAISGLRKAVNDMQAEA
jgi:hypothetical protein